MLHCLVFHECGMDGPGLLSRRVRPGVHVCGLFRIIDMGIIEMEAGIMDWKVRSARYNELQWANDDSYLKAITEMADLRPSDFVLDVGTGTGAVANYISPLVDAVIGIDSSADMLQINIPEPNVTKMNWDIRDSIFAEGLFDKVIARMSFHHILERIGQAVYECYHVLKPGGCFIIAEGVPPSQRCRAFYDDSFRHKEERRTFFKEDLELLLHRAGFINIASREYLQHGMSNKSWLRNSGLPEETQKLINDLHINAPYYVKEDYNMKITENNDCLVDVKHVIVRGEK